MKAISDASHIGLWYGRTCPSVRKRIRFVRAAQCRVDSGPRLIKCQSSSATQELLRDERAGAGAEAGARMRAGPDLVEAGHRRPVPGQAGPWPPEQVLVEGAR